MTALYKYYIPIEKDQTIKLEEKQKHLREWYDQVSLEFKKAKFTKPKCKEILSSTNVGLRHCFPEFFIHCYQSKLPFYIISGGINMVCQTILNSVININEYENFELFSNKLVFEGEYINELVMDVTATSKSEILAKAKVEKRKNCLLFGDLPSDYYMTSYRLDILRRRTNSNNIIQSLQFLRHLNDHSKLFDITLLGDGSFAIQEIILNLIENKKLSEELQKIWDSEEHKELRECLSG